MDLGQVYIEVYNLQQGVSKKSFNGLSENNFYLHCIRSLVCGLIIHIIYIYIYLKIDTHFIQKLLGNFQPNIRDLSDLRLVQNT